MPLFNRFPYTNFHELNLNWILEQIPILKKYRDETEELHDDTKVLHADTKTLHDDTQVLHDNVVEQHKEITAEITQGKKDISDLTTTGKAEITELTNTSKHEISDLTDESKHTITDLTNSGKNDLNTIITNGTNQLDTLIDTGKADIKTLTDSGKSTIETATTTGKAEITNTVTDGKAQIATAKDGALDAIGTAKDSATTTIKNLESSATSAITAKGDLYLHKIEDEGTKQTQAVTAEGTTQITNITQLGDSYKTEITTLKNDAQTSADNAKASETKAQEYAETAKTLKPMYWGGDSDNLHKTSDVKADCVNLLNTESKDRYTNLTILMNATSSPDAKKAWQCKMSIIDNKYIDLLAWNGTGEMYVGTYPAWSGGDSIAWRKTVNLDEIHAELTSEIADVEKKAWTSATVNLPVVDDTNLTIDDVISQKITNFMISSESKYHFQRYAPFSKDTIAPSTVIVKAVAFAGKTVSVFAPLENAYTSILAGSDTCVWRYSRTLAQADYDKKFNKPTLKYGDTKISATFKNSFNPLSNEYHINMSFVGVDVGEYSYKLTPDPKMNIQTPIQQASTITVIDRETNTYSLVPALINLYKTTSGEVSYLINTDKTAIVGKECYLSFTIYNAPRE